MKQKQFGKKVQNWHRPLGRNQLRQRFLRHRYDDREAELEEAQFMSGVVEVDEHWNPNAPHYCIICGRTDCLSMELPGEEIPMYRMEGFLTDLVQKPRSISISPERVAFKSDKDDSGRQDHLYDTPRRPETSIENRLAAHIRGFSDSSTCADIAADIVGSVGSPENIDIVIRGAESLGHPHLAKRICLFAPFWIRSPMTWNEEGDRSLLDHLFVHHEVPGSIYTEWFREEARAMGDLTRGFFKWVCWFILLAQGGSLKRASREFEWTVSGKFQHYLKSSPADASPVEACIYAEVMRLGGSQVEFERIVSHPAFIIDPTQESGDPFHLTFWRNTICWLKKHRESITDEEANTILDWAMHRYTEASAPMWNVREGNSTARHFAWKGRSVNATLQRAQLYYQQQLERQTSLFEHNYQWDSHDWDWEFADGSHSWSFVELTSSQELRYEGESMRHCVGSYDA